jgi:hypothetical protein
MLGMGWVNLAATSSPRRAAWRSCLPSCAPWPASSPMLPAPSQQPPGRTPAGLSRALLSTRQQRCSWQPPHRRRACCSRWPPPAPPRPAGSQCRLHSTAPVSGCSVSRAWCLDKGTRVERPGAFKWHACGGAAETANSGLLQTWYSAGRRCAIPWHGAEDLRTATDCGLTDGLLIACQTLDDSDMSTCQQSPALQ